MRAVINFFDDIFRFSIPVAWYNLKFEFCIWLMDAKYMKVVPKD